MEQNQQEFILKLSMFEQQMNQIQQQIQAVENGIAELNLLNFGLEDLRGKKDLEIMAHIGKGIFARGKLTSEELVVDVGDKNFVTKSIPETKELINKQIEKLEEVKRELNEALEKIGEEINSVLEEANNSENK